MTSLRKGIQSKRELSKGKPLWVVGDDGRFFLSAVAVKEAAISKAYIKS